METEAFALPDFSGRMVATPEPFKALAKKIQKIKINEEEAKLLIAEYETEYGLDKVPAKALRGVIKT